MMLLARVGCASWHTVIATAPAPSMAPQVDVAQRLRHRDKLLGNSRPGRIDQLQRIRTLALIRHFDEWTPARRVKLADPLWQSYERAIGHIMSRLPVDTATEIRIGLHDYKHARGGLMAQIRGIGVGAAVTLETLRDQIATQVAAQLKVDPPSITWEEHLGDVPAYLSAPVTGAEGEQLLFAVLRPAPEVAVVVNFIIYDPTLEGQAAYREACRRLISTARRP